MPIERSSVTGLLLAGGQSRRMGGGDKGLLTLAGRPMISYVIGRIRPQVGQMVINANGDPARFSSFSLPVAPDSISGFAGPLAGVLAGLRWSMANAPGATHVASVSTDTPFLPVDLVERLAAALAPGPDPIVLASSDGNVHPVIGLWPVALADDLDAYLKSGMRKVLGWTSLHGTKIVEFPFDDLDGRSVDPFFNANTPEELDEARQLLQT